MKTWLLCLGTFLMAQPLAAQTPAAPSNVVLNLTPTDSLGLFLPGYDVEVKIHFEVVDTLGFSHLNFRLSDGSNSVQLVSEIVPFQSSPSYYYQGMAIIRSGKSIWIDLGYLAYHQAFRVDVWLSDQSGNSSVPISAIAAVQ